MASFSLGESKEYMSGSGMENLSAEGRPGEKKYPVAPAIGGSISSWSGSGADRPARKADKGRQSPTAVVQSFNTWAFKREQPSNSELLLSTVSEAIALATSVSFVLYWGKGPRHEIDTPDLECLDYLTAFADRIRGTYAPGAAITLIFTDTHAELNGHTRRDTLRYFEAVGAAARAREFNTCLLSNITGLVQENSLLAHEEPSPDILRSLSTCAARWYRGEGTAEEGAIAYYRLNMVEKRAVEIAFPHSIFITFNGSKLRDLFPKTLPIFYMYSLRRGVSVKPWFVLSETPRPDRSPSESY